MASAMKPGAFTGWLVAVLVLGMTVPSWTQETPYKTYPLSVSIFNNATQLPGQGELGVWGIPVHPGIVAGTEFRYNHNPRHEWFQTVRAGYFYHRYVQHGIQLYSEFGYRRHFTSPLDFESRLGAGYLHSIPAARIFELSPEGEYSPQRSPGRPQAMISFAVGGGYTIPSSNGFRLFLAYQFYLQMPFVKEYVPMLPNTALHAGVSFPFFISNKQP